MTVSELNYFIMYISISYGTPAVQVRFFTVQDSVSTEESSNARFAVIFDPQDTEIPFTFLVETVDLSPPDAEGLCCNTINV